MFTISFVIILIIKLILLASFFYQFLLVVIYRNACVDNSKKTIFKYLMCISVGHSITNTMFNIRNELSELIFTIAHLYAIVIYVIYPVASSIEEIKKKLLNEAKNTTNNLHFLAFHKCLDELKLISRSVPQFLTCDIGRISFLFLSIIFFASIFVSIPLVKTVLLYVSLLIVFIASCIMMFVLNPGMPIVSGIIKFIDDQYYNFEIQNQDLCSKFADGTVGQLYLILSTHFIMIVLVALTESFEVINGGDFNRILGLVGFNSTILSQVILL